MTATLNSVGQIAAFLPYLIGFVPHRSVVVVGLIDGHVGMTARLDIPEAPDVEAAARHVVQAVVRGEHTGALLFAVADGQDPDPLLRAIGLRLRAFGVGVDHTARVTAQGQWRATQCSCGACPRAWTALPDISSHPAVLAHLAEGETPAPDRASVTGRLDVDREALELVEPFVAAARLHARPREVAEALDAVLHGAAEVRRLPPLTLATAAVGVQHVPMRDALLGWLMPEVFPAMEDCATEYAALRDAFIDGEAQAVLGEAAQRALDLPQERPADRMVAWAGCTPRELRPAVLTLLAARQWSHGGGTLGAAAVAQALEIDPDYRLAQLLAHAFHYGMRPILRERRRSA